MKYKIAIPLVVMTTVGLSVFFWMNKSSLSDRHQIEREVHDLSLSESKSADVQSAVADQVEMAVSPETKGSNTSSEDYQGRRLSIQKKVSGLIEEYFLLSNKPFKKDDREEIINSLATDSDVIEFFETVYSSGITEDSMLVDQQAEIRVLGVMVLEQVQKNGDEEPILRAIRGVNNRLLNQDETKGISLDLRDLVSAWSSNRYDNILQNPADEIAKLGSKTGNLDELANGFLAGMTSHVPKETLWPFLRDHVISVYSDNQNET
ncbi:hypothetical protein [Gynuella sunshinyii]|uniref:Uncharacterized protein n=1 Tax=Gynuella sunshinyii YC6258 TaxID=1445510 RepID=A0A0C5VTE4_9GAMM|nr:hypothetical protein [Gynuella sunshinyii]AJQ97957.1 hypothetical Protein YC6258_05933 [Gynuella sunshinyii YC6258]